MSDTSSSAGRLLFLDGANRDVAFAIGVAMVLAVLFVPLPPILLDVGLAVSLSLSALILMVALWVPRPVDFNSFPTLLLVVTMLRLSLNVASTRLILSEGHTGTRAAGGVIEGFSRFIASGNFVIGIIVFAILVIINFVVISKGSTRIAEVSARFSLDAMPGKQMAIDADLGAGLIDEAEARARRKHLEDETGFYGAMGRSLEVRARRRGGGGHHHPHQRGRGHPDRRDAARPERRRGRERLHDPDHRRRAGDADPGAPGLARGGHHRHQGRHGGRRERGRPGRSSARTPRRS